MYSSMLPKTSVSDAIEASEFLNPILRILESTAKGSLYLPIILDWRAMAALFFLSVWEGFLTLCLEKVSQKTLDGSVSRGPSWLYVSFPCGRRILWASPRVLS